jgi:uncharacterized protein YndB with AHSA1/START domain
MPTLQETRLNSQTDFEPVQVYQVSIKATAERIWEAITTPGFTQRYFHGARITVVPHSYRSHGPDGAVWADEQVYEYSPPRRLVHGWRSLYDAEMGQEPASRVTWEIEPQEGDRCLLTVTHDQLERSPKTARSVAGVGWMGVLTGLKTLLESGESLEL